MTQVNSIVICKDDYDITEEFKNTIRDTIMLLLDANYETTVRYDEKGLGIVSIDFDHDRSCYYGNPIPYWLSPEEDESVVWDDERETQQNDSGNNRQPVLHIRSNLQLRQIDKIES